MMNKSEIEKTPKALFYFVLWVSGCPWLLSLEICMLFDMVKSIKLKYLLSFGVLMTCYLICCVQQCFFIGLINIPLFSRVVLPLTVEEVSYPFIHIPSLHSAPEFSVLGEDPHPGRCDSLLT